MAVARPHAALPRDRSSGCMVDDRPVSGRHPGGPGAHGCPGHGTARHRGDVLRRRRGPDHARSARIRPAPAVGQGGGAQMSEPMLQPVVHERGGPSLVWLIPILTALIGASLVIHTLTDRGPLVTITFRTADGIEVEKTRIKYK